MRRLLPAAALLLAACGAPRTPPKIRTGLDVLAASGWAPLAGKRAGLITNRTGVDASGRLNVDLMAAATGFTLAAVLTPEHGFAASAEAGVKVASGAVRSAGREIPLHSLYGGGLAGMRPKPEQLAGLEILVFDIQDVGARFYTYLTTMATALEAAKAAGIPFIVLDRPNPVDGSAVEGPMPDEPGLVGESAIAYLDVPTRHGLTPGEAALLHNDRVQHPALGVVKLEGWERRMWYDDTGLPWVAPSPNMPSLDAAALYPGVANLEFTNLSVGRGTPLPFNWIGAPWLDADAVVARLRGAGLPGVRFSRRDYTPSKSVHEGKRCRGVRMTVLDRRAVRPLRVFAHLAAALRDLHPKEFQLKWSETRKLVGGAAFKPAYDAGASAAELAAVLEPDPAPFLARRRPFLLYP